MVSRSARVVETVSTSAADDNAFRALIDACRLSEDLPEARIVGGQMVGVLTLAYPDAPRVDRRTADADLGISTQIASSAILHDRLRDADYVATSGNHYERGEAQIDVLAPSPDGRFRSTVSGRRGIDLSPGLGLRVPKVEAAVILKAFATTSRNVPKDYTDLYNLLSIAYRYGEEAIGGWRLRENPPRCRRRRVDEPVRRRSRRGAGGARRPDQGARLPREDVTRGGADVLSDKVREDGGYHGLCGGEAWVTGRCSRRRRGGRCR